LSRKKLAVASEAVPDRETREEFVDNFLIMDTEGQLRLRHGRCIEPRMKEKRDC
jgi:hypothetical protein